ncbi:hypothetical protein [Psychroserpens jangbogonensis]|uniref:hypothetical protein n=1 Tax=Psychroserpens jangbogonensis TaxID=1484460 RepID=UPI0006925499|nr:hypothetical protein [Psychroserpens jangbogonensis]
MKNRINAFLFIALLSFSLGHSQTKEGALRDAKTTSKATLDQDFKTVLKHTLPKVVELMGGQEQAIPMLKKTFDDLNSQGFVFEKADILNVSEIVFEQDQHRCIVEGYNVMKMNDKRIKSKSYLLGIYNSEAQYWCFIEAKQLKNPNMMNMVFSDFQTKLEIPDDQLTTEVIEEN